MRIIPLEPNLPDDMCELVEDGRGALVEEERVLLFGLVAEEDNRAELLLPLDEEFAMNDDDRAGIPLVFELGVPEPGPRVNRATISL